MLFLRGDPAWAMFGLLDGEVRLTRNAADGTPLIVHRATAGGFVAEASLFADAYHCDGMATVPSRVVVFPKDAMIALMHRDSAVVEAFSAMLARQVQRLRAGLEIRNIRSASERVYAALALAVAETGGVFRPAATWKAFAAEIGLTHEALYRALRILEEEGRLRRRGMEVELLASSSDGV